MAAKKIKRKKPPLSILDKAIYSIVFIAGFSFSFFSLYLVLALSIRIAQTDPDVIAYSKDASLFFFLPLCVIIPLTIMLLAAYGLKAKQPIFIVKKIRMIGFQPMQKVYPIFSKAFRDDLTIQGRARIKKGFRDWLILFSISLLLMPWGLFPRDTLDTNDCFTRYNTFNQVVATHHISEAEKLCIDISVANHPRGGISRYIRVQFVFEEHTYTLEVDRNIAEIDDDFIGMDRAEELEYLLHLKSYFKKGNYEISGLDKIHYVTGYEDDLVYELFEYTAE